jgi:hypothetical protein
VCYASVSHVGGPRDAKLPHVPHWDVIRAISLCVHCDTVNLLTLMNMEMNFPEAACLPDLKLDT